MYARIVAAMILVLALGSQTAQAQSRDSFEGLRLVDKNGNIQKPEDYRDLFQTLGTYFVLDPKGGDQMHLTYASPGAADYYRRNKKFADGTVLVKEVFGDRPCADDNGRCSLGEGHESLVRADQGLERPLSKQSSVGRWMGVGRFLNLTRRTARKTVSAATSPQSRTTGSTSKVIRC